jgi:PKD repeat protein
MPWQPRRSRMLSRALAACALAVLPLALAPQPAPASRQPRANAAGVKTAKRIVRLARKELARGVHEIPDGSNRAPAIHRYDLATTPHYYGAPWCAYFVSYVARRAGAPVGPGGRGLGYVPSIRAWAQATGRWTQRPRPGELITFAEHVGIVEAVYPSSHTLTSIEGNHGNAVHRVWHRWREAMGFVRLASGNPSNPSNPAPQKHSTPKRVPHIALKARISAYPQTTIAPGQSIDFTSLDSSGNVVKSNWDLDGNGHFDSSGSSVSHRYDRAGRYTVKLKVTDSKRHTSTATATVTVNDNRAPVAVIRVPTDVTVNQNVTGDASGSYDPDGHIVRYDWDMNGDGDFGKDGTHHSFAYDRPGDYVAVLKVTDDDGNSTLARATVHVHDYPGPQSRLSCSSTNVASGTTVYCHADDSVSPTRIVKHEWDMNDDGSYSSGGSDSSYRFATPGNYTLHLRVTDWKGRQSYSTVDLRVENRAPLASITLPSKVVAGQPATIDGSHSSDPDGWLAAWEWDLDGDGSYERSGTAVSATFATPGTRTIWLRVIDDWGQAAVTSAQLRVLAPPVAAGVVTTASPAVNANTYFLPTGSSDPDGTISRYQWDFNNDGATDRTTYSASSSTYWKWTVAGSYQVRLTVTDNDGVKASVLIPVTVH